MKPNGSDRGKTGMDCVLGAMIVFLVQRAVMAKLGVGAVRRVRQRLFALL
jgi:hypothetical protein